MPEMNGLDTAVQVTSRFANVRVIVLSMHASEDFVCQAMRLKKAKGLTGLLLIGEEGDVFLAWHAVTAGNKDAGRQLLGWHDQWKTTRAGRKTMDGAVDHGVERKNEVRTK
jgi:hypothetical protein